MKSLLQFVMESTISGIKNVLWNPDGAGTDIADGILNKKVCSPKEFFVPFFKSIIDYSKQFEEKENIDIKKILQDALQDATK